MCSMLLRGRERSVAKGLWRSLSVACRRHDSSGECCLEDIVWDVEVGVDVLYVIVIFEELEQAKDLLRRALGRDRHRLGWEHLYLRGVDGDNCLFDRASQRLLQLRSGLQHPHLAL